VLGITVLKERRGGDVVVLKAERERRCKAEKKRSFKRREKTRYNIKMKGGPRKEDVSESW